VKDTQQEERINEALEGVKSGRFKSYREAARVMEVPNSTLTFRANGRQPRNQAHEEEQLLSNEEEKELVQ
jgi:helix-turn-helix, Psq domain